MSDNKPGDDQKDPLLTNKIAAAGLAALLLIFGLPQLSAALFGGGHHGGDHEELHLAYCCVELETTAASGEAEEVYDLGAMMADASVTAGERGAALCISCHTLVRGGANGTGPNLWNIVGREIAGVSDFNYTGALAGLDGVWTYERLDQYLANSQEYVPGGAMVQRIGRDNKRAELLAFLGSLSDNPMPFPEPLPVEATASGDALEDAAVETIDGAVEAVGDAVEDAAEAATDGGE
jgi:cytochrome c